MTRGRNNFYINNECDNVLAQCRKTPRSKSPFRQLEQNQITLILFRENPEMNCKGQ